MTKNCKKCNKVFEKAYTTSRAVWQKQLLCSQKCYGDSIRGQSRPLTEETKRKIGLANINNRSGLENGKQTRFVKGRVSPRKDKKYPQVAGEKCHFWKGGITPKNIKIRGSLEYRLWRQAVLTRDDYTCQTCGQRGGDLHVDHELPFSLYPDLRFEVLNGRVLCIPCHRKTPTYGWSNIHQTDLAIAVHEY